MRVQVVGDADCYVRDCRCNATLRLDLTLLVSSECEHGDTVSSRHSCWRSVGDVVGFPVPWPTYYTYKTRPRSPTRNYSSNSYASHFPLQKNLPFQFVAIVEMNLIASSIIVLLRFCPHRRSKQSSEPLPALIPEYKIPRPSPSATLRICSPVRSIRDLEIPFS